MILLDTVVVSELRKTRPNPRVIAWMRSLRETDVFLSVVTIGEIERGIRKVRDTEFALALTRWLEDLLRFYGDRILPVSPTSRGAGVGSRPTSVTRVPICSWRPPQRRTASPWRRATCVISRRPA